MIPYNKIDIKKGTKYGFLTILSEEEPIVKIYKTSGKCYSKRRVKCKCKCGREKVVLLESIRIGTVQSCGCLQKTRASIAKTTHGMSGNPIYNIWLGMMRRCYNSNYKEYFRWGGRGIKVCKDWHNMKTFIKWAETNGYDKSLTIERIDNDGHYSPNNCKWATNKEQMNNRRNNFIVEFNGEKKTLAEWSELYGIPRSTIRNRYVKSMSLDDLLKNK